MLTTINLPKYLQRLYDNIPKSEVKQIIDSKANVMNRTKDKIRAQCYIPNEIYILLKYYGLLRGGEAEFFTHMAVNALVSLAVGPNRPSADDLKNGDH